MGLGFRAAMLAVLAAGLAIGGEAQARPQVSTSYTYYPVSGSSAIDLYNAMIRRGPHVNGSQAYAMTSFAPDSKVSIIPGKTCRVHFQFKLKFTIRLPRLTNESALSGQTRSTWREFSSFVRRHEETHRSIWTQCMQQLENKIDGIRGRDCLQAAKQAVAYSKQIMASCNRKQAAFDAAEQQRVRKHAFIKLVINNYVKRSRALAVKKKKKNFSGG
jgi:predicted secreted Zn-dependent protease